MVNWPSLNFFGRCWFLKSARVGRLFYSFFPSPTLFWKCNISSYKLWPLAFFYSSSSSSSTTFKILRAILISLVLIGCLVLIWTFLVIVLCRAFLESFLICIHNHRMIFLGDFYMLPRLNRSSPSGFSYQSFLLRYNGITLENTKLYLLNSLFIKFTHVSRK